MGNEVGKQPKSANLEVEQQGAQAGEGTTDFEDEIAVEGKRSLDEIMRWRRNGPLLYDLYLEFGIHSPPLTVHWLGDEPDEACSRLAFGTGSSDSESACQVVVAELSCVADMDFSTDPWKRWKMEGFRDCSGFGAKPFRHTAPLRVVCSMDTTSEVNRIVPCPSRPKLLAAKGSSGVVSLMDYKLATGNEPTTGLVKTFQYAEEPVDGFALAWSSLEASWLATGGNDGSISLWDVESSVTPARPLWAETAHEAPLNDISFSKYGPQLITVGEDLGMSIWDLREGRKASFLVGPGECLTVDWSPLDPNLVASGRKDSMVNVWDMRSFKDPLKSLSGHRGEVHQVRWCPTSDKVGTVEARSLMATCSQDAEAILWNLEPHGEEVDEDGEDQAPEVYFVHSGHRKGVLDFDWSSLDDLLMCSVGEDCTLQVWQPSLSVLDDEDEPVERAAKRNRTE
mmetsp:Transcript_46235/g.86282  ORF Transcript_46235/g.86282 Transcript_46235/m.86282 type:complete len:453 (-) Transcript_46235:24-1382(-)